MKQAMSPTSNEYEQLVQWIEELDPEERPSDLDEWGGPDSYPVFSDGFAGRPFAPTEMLEWVPETIVERFGVVTLNDDWSWVEFKVGDEANLIGSFATAEYDCARDDGLVRRATAHW